MVTFIQKPKGGEGRSHEKYLGEELSRQEEQEQRLWGRSFPGCLRCCKGWGGNGELGGSGAQ